MMPALPRGLTAARVGSLVLASSLAVVLAACTPDMSSRGVGLFDSAQPGDIPKASALPTPALKPSAVPKPAPAPTANNNYQDTATWRHLPEPVTAERYNQDKANCTRLGNNAPGAGSPDMKFFLVYSKCMRSAGYAPN
jgi:hypothetical protein